MSRARRRHDWVLQLLVGVYDITNAERHRDVCTAFEVARHVGAPSTQVAGRYLSDLARDGMLVKSFERQDYATYRLTPEGRVVALARKADLERLAQKIERGR